MSNIKTIRSKVINRIKELYPDKPEENINQLIDEYFKFFKSRVITLDKLEFRLLNVGTINTKANLLIRSIGKKEQAILDFKESLLTCSEEEKVIINRKISVLEKYLSEMIPAREKTLTIFTKGKTSRKKIKQL